MSGDMAKTVYFVESGSVRIAMQTASGKECLLRIQTSGEIFGEISLLGSGSRMETATARERSVVWQMTVEEFFHELRKRSLCEEFMLTLIRRVMEEETRITELVTEPSRRRLGKMLLLLARREGTPTGAGLRIDLRISHDEWAAMVGTTRPRVSTFFADFRRMKLLDVSRERHLIVHEARLHHYLGES
jgi:CRP-like cAMP-binding protein